MASSSEESKKARQESSEKSKKSPIKENYTKNVQFINSALKEETLKDNTSNTKNNQHELNSDNRLLEKNSESLSLLADNQNSRSR